MKPNYQFTKPAFFIVLLSTLSIVKGQEKGDPKLTEVWEPEPKVVTPGVNNAPPSDAIVLFDGSSLKEWKGKDGEAPWVLEGGAMTVKPQTGAIQTKRAFGDVQLHIEWRTPTKIEGEGQGRGNSGIFLQGLYEVQVLDSFENRTYANGQAGSIYKQHIPLANACRPPGEWQTYDIIYQAPLFKSDGSLGRPARVTVIHNGVLIQNSVELEGPSLYIGKPKYKAHAEKLPLVLQDHNNPVSYRNIWIREL